jgi:hypothetical protein
MGGRGGGGEREGKFIQNINCISAREGARQVCAVSYRLRLEQHSLPPLSRASALAAGSASAIPVVRAARMWASVEHQGPKKEKRTSSHGTPMTSTGGGGGGGTTTRPTS